MKAFLASYHNEDISDVLRVEIDDTYDPAKGPYEPDNGIHFGVGSNQAIVVEDDDRWARCEAMYQKDLIEYPGIAKLGILGQKEPMKIDIQKKKKALLDTRKLWTRIKEHPELSKQNAAEFLGMDKNLYYCPCCEYSIRNTKCECDKSDIPCPLFDYAWPRQDRGCCVSASSPYYLYDEAIKRAKSHASIDAKCSEEYYPITHKKSLRDIVTAATSIINACGQALASMGLDARVKIGAFGYPEGTIVKIQFYCSNHRAFAIWPSMGDDGGHDMIINEEDFEYL